MLCVSIYRKFPEWANLWRRKVPLWLSGLGQVEGWGDGEGNGLAFSFWGGKSAPGPWLVVASRREVPNRALCTGSGALGGLYLNAAAK